MKVPLQPRCCLPIICFLMTLIFIFGNAHAQNETHGASETGKSTFPPAWVAEFKGSVDAGSFTGKPWDRIEKFIEEGTDQSRKEAAKFAYESARLGKLSKDREIASYFLAGEYDWALYELENLNERNADDWSLLARIYSHFGEYRKALDAIARAIELAANAPPMWRAASLADLYEKQGDIHAQIGDTAKARESYANARSHYNQITAKRPGLRVAKIRGLDSIQSKMDMLDIDLLQVAHYADGMYQDHAFGYSGDIVCWVETADGKIREIKLQHKEKSDLNASKILPAAILKAQNPGVDIITGATVTSNAIKNCVFESLKHAAGIE